MTSRFLELCIGIFVGGDHRARKVASVVDNPSQQSQTQLPLQSSQWIVTIADGCSEYPALRSSDQVMPDLARLKLLLSFFHPQGAIRVAGLLEDLRQLQVGPGAKG